jgi:hypothetical protein
VALLLGLYWSDLWVFCAFDWFSDVSFCGFADLLHILSFLPKDLNFMNHSNYIGWREYDINYIITSQICVIFCFVNFVGLCKF